MSNKEVYITCSPKGIESIFADREELDCAPIKGKDISDWFSPSNDRSGWKGLMQEIYDALCDDTVEVAFIFFGPEEQKKRFYQYLDAHKISYAGAPSDIEKAEKRFEDANRAKLRGNEREALRLYSDAADLGHTQAKLKYAEYLSAGKDIDNSNAGNAEYKAFVLYSELAEQGIAEAIWCLIRCFKEGIGTNTNPSAVKDWLKKLVDMGDVTASAELDAFIAEEKRAATFIAMPEQEECHIEHGKSDGSSTMVSEQQEEKKDESAYIDVQQKTAREESRDPLLTDFMQQRALAFAGDVTSQYLTGRYFLDGRGVNKDNVSAFYWFEKASEGGHKMAMYYTGVCYEYGWGVDRNRWKAIEYYKRSGTSEAIMALKRIKEVDHISRTAKGSAYYKPYKPKKEGALDKIGKFLKKRK